MFCYICEIFLWLPCFLGSLFSSFMYCSHPLPQSASNQFHSVHHANPSPCFTSIYTLLFCFVLVDTVCSCYAKSDHVCCPYQACSGVLPVTSFPDVSFFCIKCLLLITLSLPACLHQGLTLKATTFLTVLG
ncbi:hypothetical protein AMECASPLE_036569 [Ameca splendens]|uniref:Secreted protein n=1 Tax=Ameca splendens TaxID=208324 RepID=A0ABV0Z7D8_9TELE